MAEIDNVIEQHDGCQDAFQTGSMEEVEKELLLKPTPTGASYGTGKERDKK